MRKTRASLYLIGATLATVIVLFVLPITPKVAVSTAPIRRGQIVDTLSLSATVSYLGQMPCVAPVAGQVSEVFVRQGDSVVKGQLLASMDASAEEDALAFLLALQEQQRRALAQMKMPDTVLTAVSAQNTLSTMEETQKLRLTIEGKQLRALSNGVVAQVYAQAGDALTAGGMVLSTHAGACELKAQARLADAARLKNGMQASLYQNGQKIGTAQVTGFDAPLTVSGQLMQTVRLTPQEDLSGLIGEEVEMELVCGATEQISVAPVSALSATQRIWVVRDGRAYPQTMGDCARDEEQVGVPTALDGLNVVLEPDETKLYQGCYVKERKQ